MSYNREVAEMAAGSKNELVRKDAGASEDMRAFLQSTASSGGRGDQKPDHNRKPDEQNKLTDQHNLRK
ncbi:hypothetical protein ACVNS2_23760 [Paenibacillus caseinilyticus]|nr:hypothetical protein [Paenibacillus mucilaginosus]AFH63686.1 hypothetical protein B2K_23875 [Paenibacillus mucilaginosus K02]